MEYKYDREDCSRLVVDIKKTLGYINNRVHNSPNSEQKRAEVDFYGDSLTKLNKFLKGVAYGSQ